MINIKLSVALATHNEEENLEACLNSVNGLADEIVIVDGASTDKTVEIVQKYKVKIIKTSNPPNFHINKQKAIDACQGDWILLLDADERITDLLKKEILQIITMNKEEIINRKMKESKLMIFRRHQQLIEIRDGIIGNKEGEIVAFYLPRKNIFLGHWLQYGGVYPDGVIRLFKKGKAYLPCDNVHEQIKVEGKVSWLENDLLHLSDPDFNHYLNRLNRYTNLVASDFAKKQISFNIFNWFKYLFLIPKYKFLLLVFRYKAFKDGFPGLVFAYCSAIQPAIAYIKYWENKNAKKID